MKKLLAIVALLASVSMSQAFIVYFNLVMNGAQEVPSNTSTATGGRIGNANLFYDTTVHKLTMSAAYGSIYGFSDLNGTFTAVHIHKGAAGVSGPVEIDLAPYHTTVNGKSGFIGSGTGIPFTTAQEADLLAGLHYVNVHSTAYPNGEIRGQLVPVPEPTTFACIAGLGLVAFAAYRRFVKA